MRKLRCEPQQTRRVEGERLLGAVNAVLGKKTLVPQGGALMVYKLKP